MPENLLWKSLNKEMPKFINLKKNYIYYYFKFIHKEKSELSLYKKRH